MQRTRGYTVIELLVVMAAIGLLLSIAAPRFAEHIDRSREVVLRQNLAGLRTAIDKFYADRGRYPKELQELAVERYLRAVPVDPTLDRSDAWVAVAARGAGDGVFDVRSGSKGTARDGTLYASW
jgi:general secretion pathway protein G